MPYGMPPPGPPPPFMPPSIGGPPPLPGIAPQPPPSARSLETLSSTGTPPSVPNGAMTASAGTGESHATTTSHQTSAVAAATSVTGRQPGEPYLVYADNEISIVRLHLNHFCEIKCLVAQLIVKLIGGEKSSTSKISICRSKCISHRIWDRKLPSSNLS